MVPFAHTLKGRAGLLGMTEVASIASRLEVAANARTARVRWLLWRRWSGVSRPSSLDWVGFCLPDADAEVFR